MFSPSVRARTILLALVLFVGCLAAVHARGRAENESRQRLAEVESLIEEKRYYEAVRLLSEVVKENPDRFDAVEALMERIRERRAEIDQTFAELNAALQESDAQVVERLITQLEDLNPYPSPSEEELMAMIRGTGVILVARRQRHEQLMARARAQIQAGEYRAAISTYLEGSDSARDYFNRAGLGNIAVDAVNSALDDMNQAVDLHDTLSETLSALGEELGTDPAAVEEQSDAAETALRSMASAAGTVARSGDVFVLQHERISEVSENLLGLQALTFAREYAQGPREEEAEDAVAEGIASAMDSIWRGELSALDGTLLQQGQAAYAAVVSEFRLQDAASAEALTRADTLFSALLDLQSLWPLRVRPASAYPLGPAGESAFSEALPGFLRTKQYLKALDDYRTLSDTEQRVAELTEKEVTTIQEINADREELLGFREELDAMESSLQSDREQYQRGSRLGIPLGAHSAEAAEVLADIDSTREGILELDSRLLIRVVRVRVNELVDLYDSYEADFEQGKRFQDGIENPEADRIEKYPARALPLFRPLEANMDSLIEEGETLLADAERSREYVGVLDELEIQIASLRELLDDANTLETELETRLPEAEQAALNAERYKREGVLRFQQAQANARNQRFADARQNIRVAQEALDNSLVLQEDAEVRRIREEDLIALSEDINEREKQFVIVEVRRRIEQGRTLYAQGDFTGAADTLQAAQARWLDTYPTENEEVSFWLGLVRSAVDATTGREIEVTDPLYKEMSQLYNLALGDFQSAQRLIEQGESRDTNQVVQALARAENRINKILVPFPFNARARVLYLRILQIRDPDAFGRLITERYNEALRLRTASPQEAYAQLKDIEQLLPTYPGLQTAMANLEVTLGLRLPPPDPARLTRSEALTRQARSILDSNQRDLFASAIEILDEAIELNPENREASAIKDRLLVATGGVRVDVLPPDDQRLLREAEAKYLSGAYFEALVIIEQLLRKPTNQNNREIRDLEKRIRAKTG